VLGRGRRARRGAQRLGIGAIAEERRADLAHREAGQHARIVRRQGRARPRTRGGPARDRLAAARQRLGAPQVIEGAAGRRGDRRLALGAGADRGGDQPAGQLGAGDQRLDGRRAT
jgi:hypothetical protein